MLVLRIVAANLVMAGILIWLAGDMDGWIAAGTLERVGRCALCLVVAAATYFAALFAFGMRYRHVASQA